MVARLEESIGGVKSRIDGVERTLTSQLDRHISHCHNKFMDKVDSEHMKQQLGQLASQVAVLHAAVKSSAESWVKSFDERMVELAAERQRDHDEVNVEVAVLRSRLELAVGSAVARGDLDDIRTRVRLLDVLVRDGIAESQRDSKEVYKDVLQLRAQLEHSAGMIPTKEDLVGLGVAVDQLRTDYAAVLEGLSGGTDRVQKLGTVVQQLQDHLRSHATESDKRYDKFVMLRDWVTETFQGLSTLEARVDWLREHVTTQRRSPDSQMIELILEFLYNLMEGLDEFNEVWKYDTHKKHTHLHLPWNTIEELRISSGLGQYPVRPLHCCYYCFERAKRVPYNDSEWTYKPRDPSQQCVTYIRGDYFGYEPGYERLAVKKTSAV